MTPSVLCSGNMVVVNGADLWTELQGQGFPLVLCAGGPGLCDYLGPVSDMIDDLTQVLRFEQRGCGCSEHVPPYDLNTAIADLEALRIHFGFEKWIVAGHSWGANLAIAYALKYSHRVSAIMYISGPGVQNNREWKKAYNKGKSSVGELVPEFKHAVNLEVNVEGNASWRRFIQRADLFAKIAALQTPILIVYGDEDIRPSWPAEQLANLMPNARFETINGAQHFIWITHANELRKALKGFLQAVLE